MAVADELSCVAHNGVRKQNTLRQQYHLLMRFNEKTISVNHRYLLRLNEKTDYSSNSAKSQSVGIRGVVLSE